MTPDELEAIKRSGDPYALGARPSGVRTTDFVLRTAPQAAPSAFAHSAIRKVPMKNQQGGTCVGNAIATCMTYLEWIEKNDVVVFDGEALNMRVVGRDYGQGAAASPHDVLEDIRLHGAQAPEGLYFPKAYGWVEFAKESIKTAMSTPGQVVTAAIWLQENFGMDGGKTPAPYVAGDAWGYHEVTFAAYDDAKGVRIQNSWDTWWGEGGFAWLSWDYVLQRLGECWAITDNPDTAKDGFVKTYDYGTAATERAVKRADLPDRKRPAVYLVKSNGRIWITDPWQAKRFGVNLYQVEVLADTDPVWSLPVIGPDAARNLR